MLWSWHVFELKIGYQASVNTTAHIHERNNQRRLIPNCRSQTVNLPTFPTSSSLGLAGALALAARARSAPLGRPTWPLEPALLRWGVRCRSAPTMRSQLLGMAARAHFTWRCIKLRSRSARPVRPTFALELARFRWGARHPQLKTLKVL